MKYIKKFESFGGKHKLDTDTSLVVNDICIELEDKGFTIEFRFYYDNRLELNKGVLYIYKLNSIGDEIPIDFDDVKETIDRIKEYLGDKWITMVEIFGNSESDDDDDDEEECVWSISIEFKNE